MYVDVDSVILYCFKEVDIIHLWYIEANITMEPNKSFG